MDPKELDTPAQPSQLNIYAKAFQYSSTALCFSYPLDRLRFALQTTPNRSTWAVLKPFLTGNYRALYHGATLQYIRQMTKTFSRTANISYTSPWVDSYQLPFLLSDCIKSTGVALADILTVPLDNTRARYLHMKQIYPQAPKAYTLTHTLKTIMQEQGCRGFFHGVSATFAESSITWFYFLASYQGLKTTRDQTSFLSTLLWAMVAAIPLTVLTLPFEAWKYRTMTLQPNHIAGQTFRETAKNIMQHGVFSCRQGMFLRMLQKGITTAVGYGLLDASTSKNDNAYEAETRVITAR